MANIKLRTPYTITKTIGGAISYAIMDLTLNSASSPQYSVRKDYIVSGASQSSVYFEISELSRDYLDLTFGDDLVSNGDFDDGTTDWTFTGDVSLVGNEVFFDNATILSSVTQSNVFVVGQFYEVTYEVTSHTQDGLNIRRFGVDDDTGTPMPMTVGIHTVSGIAYITDLDIKRRPSESPTVKITNISATVRGSDDNHVDIAASVKSYNANGDEINVTTYTHDGFDGWSEFSEGANLEMAASSLAQTNTTVYVPENVGGSIPFFDTTGLSYSAFNDTDTSITVEGTVITINRICESKFNPIKVTFVNKYGAFQDIYFDKKNTEGLIIKRDSFARNLASLDGSYSIHSHSKKVLNVLANEDITMNTGFVDEGMNEAIKELLLSEQIWANIDNRIYPVNVTESSHTYKTSVNDKLVNYTMKFEYAFDLINNIR